MELNAEQRGEFIFNFLGYERRVKVIHLVYIAVLFGSAIRFFGLENQGLWYDELHSVIQADPDLTFSEVIEYCRKDQPPLFFLLLQFWFKLFQYSDFYARLFVAIVGVLGIVVMYFLGKEMKDEKTGALAALLVSVNYFHVQYSQEVRFYSLVFLLSGLSLLFFLRSVKRLALTDFLLYAVFTSAVVYTHYYGLVVVASHALLFLGLLVFRKNNERAFVLGGFLSGVAILILIAPWLPQYVQDSQITEFWIEPVKFPRFIFSYFYHYFENILLAICMGGFFLFFSARPFWLQWKNKEKSAPEVWLLLASIVLSYAIPLIYSALYTPLLVIRYTIITLPAIFVILAMSVDLVKPKLQSYVLVVFFSISWWTIVYGQHYYSRIRKEQLREVAKKVMEKPLEPVVVFSYYAWHYNYYFKTLGWSHRAVHPESVDYQRTLASVDYVWLIQCHEENVGATREQLALIHQDFNRLDSVKLVGAQGLLFKRKEKLHTPGPHNK